MYIVIETQTIDDVCEVNTETFETYNEAMSAFHFVLGSSTYTRIHKHACVVIGDEGEFIKSECILNLPEPIMEEPEPEPEPQEPEQIEPIEPTEPNGENDEVPEPIQEHSEEVEQP